MIYIGIDDTDMPDTPGTNQLARALVETVRGDFTCRFILRHQLLSDPRVPFTSKNGSASILLEPRGAAAADLSTLIGTLRRRMLDWFVPGSDPGLCVTTEVPQVIREFGRACQRELISQHAARDLAARHGIHLEGLGGTEGGVIGALAAVGLAATGDDGRVVVLGEWPDDLSGPQPVERVRERDIEIVAQETSERIAAGTVDVGKHLRPNYRAGRVVLFVRAQGDRTGSWEAVRLP